MKTYLLVLVSVASWQLGCEQGPSGSTGRWVYIPCLVVENSVLVFRSKSNISGGPGSSLPMPSLCYPLLRAHAGGDSPTTTGHDSWYQIRAFLTAATVRRSILSGQPVSSALDPLRRESGDSGVPRPALKRLSLAATANRRLAVPAPSTTRFRAA